MSEVKKWSTGGQSLYLLDGSPTDDGFILRGNTEVVRASDYDTLTKENAALRAERDKTRGIVNQLVVALEMCKDEAAKRYRQIPKQPNGRRDIDAENAEQETWNQINEALERGQEFLQFPEATHDNDATNQRRD